MPPPTGPRFVLVALALALGVVLVTNAVILFAFRGALSGRDWVVSVLTAAIVGTFLALLLVRARPAAAPEQEPAVEPVVAGRSGAFQVEGERVIEVRERR